MYVYSNGYMYLLLDTFLPPHVVTRDYAFQIRLLASLARHFILIPATSDLASSAVETCSLLSMRDPAGF